MYRNKQMTYICFYCTAEKVLNFISNFLIITIFYTSCIAFAKQPSSNNSLLDDAKNNLSSNEEITLLKDQIKNLSEQLAELNKKLEELERKQQKQDKVNKEMQKSIISYSKISLQNQNPDISL